MTFDMMGKPLTLQEAINSVQLPAWPFITLKFIKSTTVKKTTLPIEVSPTLYEWITKSLSSDELIMYFIPSAEVLRSWTPDMKIAIDIMGKLGLMSKADTWIRVAREGITNFLRSKTNFKHVGNNALIPQCEEILTACNLMEPHAHYELLLSISKDAINSKTKDPDTLIYRLAMAIFHYAFMSPPIITGVENWEGAYLSFTQNKEINSKYPQIKNELEGLTTINKPTVFKTLLSFLIAAYVYYRGVQEIE